MRHRFRFSTTVLRRSLISAIYGVLAGAISAVVWPSVRALSTKLTAALLAAYPAWAIFPFHVEFLGIAIAACIVILLLPWVVSFFRRIWASWRVGISPGLSWLWYGGSVSFVFVFDAGYPRLSWIPLCLCLLLTGLHIQRVERMAQASDSTGPSNLDVPIGSWSEDKLHRELIVESLESEIAEKCARVLALIAPYGDGKTSVLNLLEFTLKANQGIRVVRYSSWLPGSEEILVATFFNSIVQTLEKDFLLGKARKDFIKYARSVANIIPSATGKMFREWFREPSQSEQISELKRIIREFPVRVVVLVDDVDRMHQGELQALLKLIRGISDFSNMTYVCAFHMAALVKAMNPLVGDASEYLEKFFPIKYPLPPIDTFVLTSEFMLDRISQT
jgi:hypothetical protein